MNVAAILKHKGRDVFTCDCRTTLDRITRILDENHIGSVVIVDEGERVVGIVSERDVVCAIAKRGAMVLDEDGRHLGYTPFALMMEPTATRYQETIFTN